MPTAQFPAGTGNATAAGDPNAAAAGAGEGGAPGGAGQDAKQPCATSTSPSQKNRDTVNQQNQGKPCPFCDRPIADVTAAISARRAAALLRGRAPYQTAVPTRFDAEHIYPASAIKADKRFQEMEKKCPDQAREVMTDQNNMMALCPSCNRSKRATPLHEYGGSMTPGMTPQVNFLFRAAMPAVYEAAKSRITSRLAQGCT